MKLVMDTENARGLATVYGQQSDDVLRMGERLRSFLERAAMDDTFAVAGSLELLSEDLRLGDVVLRHQADVMDGLTVDVDALSQELGVERWRVDKQLRRLDRGDITAGEVLISIVDFGRTDVVGLDTTIRDFVPDGPELGADPAFDALIQRLDGWLLSTIVDGRGLDDTTVTAGRLDDLELLGRWFDMPDLADVTTTRQIRRTEHQGQGEDLKVTYHDETIPLPTSEWEEWAFEFITERLVTGRTLGRMAQVPSLGELMDFRTYTESYERRVGQDEYRTAERTIERTPAEIAAEISDFNEAWALLDWVPTVMAGLGEPPEALASNRVLQNQLVKLAREFGYEGELSTAEDGVSDPLASDRALTYLTAIGGDRIASSLETPRPIQTARLPMAGPALRQSIELGRRHGVVTLDDEANARTVALYLNGIDTTIDPAALDPATLDADAPELDTAELVGLLATAVPPQHLGENRLIQTITYIQRAETVGQRIERIERAILGLKTVTTIGEPAMTHHDWLRSLPTKVRGEEFDVDIQGREFNWLLDHAGVPGYHKSQDWRKGGGKRYFHLVNEADGRLDDFIVEKIPKKRGWFGQALMTVAKVGISIAFPPMGVAIAAMDAVIAATQGDWLGAGLAAVGALAAGTAAWAGSATSAASTATSNAVAAADALATGAGSLQALTTANQAVTAATSTATLANTAANAAQFVNAGVKAGVAFSQDDVLGGVVNSVTAIGAGASGFGYGEVGKGLVAGASAIQAVDALENEDYAGALAGGLTTASSVVDLRASAGVADGTIEAAEVDHLGRVATTLDDAANVTRTGGAIARSIEEEQWASLVGSGLRFGGSAIDLVANTDGAVADLVFDRDDRGFEASTDRLETYGGWLDGAADLADSGVAFADGDHLGGTALLSSGTTGLLRDTRFASTNLERFDDLATIADKLATAGPDLDHATAMGLIGTEMGSLIDSFEPAPAPPTGSPVQRLRQARIERRAAEAGLDRLDELLTFDATDGDVAALLGGTRSDLAREVSRWSRLEARAEADRVAELAARRRAAARLPSHVPTLRPALPSHVPMLRPALPGHLPMLRPPVLPAGPIGPFRPAPISLDDFPLLHRAKVYETLGPYHPGLLGSPIGDWNLEGTQVIQSSQTGQLKVPAGFLGVGSMGQETFADGRIGLGFGYKFGARVGADGPILPRVQAGYAYDHLGGEPFDLFGTPIDIPGGGQTYQVIGPAPGVVPSEFASLTAPWTWPVGTSVRLNDMTGAEHHTKGGNAGKVRLSLFDDEIRHDLGFYQITNQGDSIEVARGPVDVNVSQPGLALNVPLPFLGLEEARVSGSYQFVDGEASISSVHYDPWQPGAYADDLLTGQPAAGLPRTYTDAIFGSHQGWVDLTVGPSSPRFDSSLNAAKLIPNSQWLVASSQLPDGAWRTDYSSGGRSQDRIEGSTTIGPGGSIDDLRITSSVGGPSGDIAFELDADDYTAVLESIEQNRDPVLALEGRDGLSAELFRDPLTRARLRDQLVEIQDMGELSANHPIAGNLTVRETSRGEPVLEMTNPYPSRFWRETADEWLLPMHANPPFDNTMITASEVADGLGRGAGEVWERWKNYGRYARDGAAWIGVNTPGLNLAATEADQAYAAEFEQEYLDATLATGEAMMDYGASRWDDWGLIPGDIAAAGNAAWAWGTGLVEAGHTAWEEGDGEALGYGAAHLLGGGVEAAVGAKAVTTGARASRAMARGRTGDDPVPGGAANRAVFERYRAELDANDASFPGGAANRTTFERYRTELRAQALKPPVEDARLARIVDTIYRDDATIGSGSTVAAARRERSTGRPTIGRSGEATRHHQKVVERTRNLEKWLRDHPTARPGDRQVAEDILADHKRYLEDDR